MKFEWKDRSEHEEMILELTARFLGEKLMRIRHYMTKHASSQFAHETVYLDDATDGIYAVMELLSVDFEWLFEFMQLRRGDERLPLLGNTPADLLPRGYSFELRHISTCDEATNARPCCVRPHVFIVKATSPLGLSTAQNI